MNESQTIRVEKSNYDARIIRMSHEGNSRREDNFSDSLHVELDASLSVSEERRAPRRVATHGRCEHRYRWQRRNEIRSPRRALGTGGSSRPG